MAGGWGPSGASKGSSEWVGDWGSESATSTAASQGLSTPAAQGSAGSSAGGSGLGGLGDAEAVVKADVGAPQGTEMASGSGGAEGWKPEGVGCAGGVAAAGGYRDSSSGMEEGAAAMAGEGANVEDDALPEEPRAELGGGSDATSMGDVGFQADQGRAMGGGAAAGGPSMQPASAVGNAGQEIRGSGGNISGGAGAEFGERADFEAGGGILDGVAGRVQGIEDALPAVAGSSYEGIEGMMEGSGMQGSGSQAGGGSGQAGGQAGQAGGIQGVPEGRLSAGGDDAQAAVGADAASTGVATSDSTAERVAQVYGIGPEASPGAEEAEQYKAEAGQEGSKGDKGQSA